ncbi:hypothetical protein F4861DRAFT_467048 [Xylaria intraflava]|nr:hypothetical protein F4861DRAFT_467048 [Xylaria intraflava]
MDHPPFSANNELCKSLAIATQGQASVLHRTTHRLVDEQKTYLPGEPNIQLDNESISVHLQEELATRDLDQLSSYLWLVMKQDSSHIPSLTHQIVRGREIVITEEPGLHLVWYYNHVFIKPLPKYMLSHAFWAFYLISPNSPIQEPLRSDLRKAALGFLRSYRYLVRRRSDFELAMDKRHRLLPKKTNYADFIKLIRSLDTVDDSMVSPRYTYGELRLSRLNFWIKLFLFRLRYHKPEGQYGPYIARFYGPLLFLFGIFSVQLSAMQVVLATIPLTNDLTASWVAFIKVSKGYSVFTLLAVAIIPLFLVGVAVCLLSLEILRVVGGLHRNRWQALYRTGGDGGHEGGVRSGSKAS